MQGARFSSKRDRWLVALVWAVVLVTLAAGLAQLRSGAPAAVRGLVFLLLAAAAAFILWVVYGTSYRLAEGELRVRCGPFRYRVPFAGIESVTPSRDPRSSPASSLDRLLIRWSPGDRRLLVSPEPRAEFLRELARRCPQLSQEGERLTGRG